MAKSNSQRKTHSDKFPLTLHKPGRYCKKIMGKIYLNGEIKLRHFYDSTSLRMDFVKFVAPNRAVSDISTVDPPVDLQNYRKKADKD